MLFEFSILLGFLVPRGDSKGIYFVEERNGKTYTQPLTGQATDKIGEQIRELFNIDINPNGPAVKANNYVSTYMKRLYKQLENYEHGENHNEEEVNAWLSADRIVSHMAQEVSHRLDDGSYSIRFAKEHVPAKEGQSIVRAQLRIHIQGIVSPVFFYIEDTNLPGDTVLVSSDDPTVVTDVTTMVDRWSHLQLSTLPIVTARASTNDELKIEAFLVIALKDEDAGPPKKRSRRSASTTPISAPPMRQKVKRSESAYFEKPNENERCQRKGLYVDFDILGWKQWVIAPEGFSAFYCSGDCSAPFSKEMNATSHAIVQSTLHRVRPNSTTPAKCAPSSLGSYKILFVDQNKQVQIKRYRDMVVDECGCH
ncbi:TGF-beta family profile domain-containing protein [Caenorhabditis elegans]|uniref:TGF-beta family profile domain-containing protein n=1 Tax=Caenorhabditis elegans TaxID=6239 RepID=O16273_CAEEL|nr:TGF-beta family profile domain-containing protein [Caenorhabditis elegans]CCD65248.1 TGF-beta family profile domain-containing protein [Caenorhabditis elegans]|eukprot:NP_504271.1 TransformIng Growth factor beta family [Caenorhabditis elegans]